MFPDLMRSTAIRWRDPDPKHVPLLAAGGITAVVTAPSESFEKACAEAGIVVFHDADLQVLKPEDIGKARPGAPLVIQAGLWPGVQRTDPQKAGATQTLWLDQNCWLVNYLRAAFPDASRVLGYQPDRDAGVSEGQLIPYDALELALTDAWVPGGNYLLAPPPHLLEGIRNGVSGAIAAWQRLGRTARWLRANEALFRERPLPIVTILVDSDVSQEIASLAFRHSVSPNLASALKPPAPDPARCQVLVAVAIDKPSAAARSRILAHAAAGGIVVVDGAWWRGAAVKPLRTDAERDYYALGKGQLVVYRQDVEDPGSTALDIIDILTQKRRAARIWNCHAGVAMATAAPAGAGSALLHVINYSRPVEVPVLARIQGAYRRATLLRPEADPLPVKVAPRAGGSEVTIPSLQRVATVVFQ